MEWQPIETAPKDGTWILVTGQSWGDDARPVVGVTRWESKVTSSWQYTDSRTQKLVDRDTSDWDYDTCDFSITHWMPLPSPPQENSETK